LLFDPGLGRGILNLSLTNKLRSEDLDSQILEMTGQKRVLHSGGVRNLPVGIDLVVFQIVADVNRL